MIPAGWKFSRVRDFRQHKRQLHTKFGKEKEMTASERLEKDNGTDANKSQSFERCCAFGAKEEEKPHKSL